MDAHQTLMQCQTAGFNPYYQTGEAVFAEIQLRLLPHVEHPVDEIYFYGAGCNNAEKNQIIRQALQKAFPHTQHIDIQTDMLAAARALCGRQPGIACILGTGANACRYDGEKVGFQPFSIGFWLGDEGSGGWIGRNFLAAFLREELSPALLEKFEHHFQTDKYEILDRLYRQPFPNRYAASFTWFLHENLHETFVSGLIREGFDLFIKRFVQKIPDFKHFPVHFTGSVAFHFEEILLDALQQTDLQTGQILEIPMDGLVKYHRLSL
jgi:glucosamine kinase